MPSFLVTGGCGFIGSHLCAALIARGDRVRVLDDLSSGSLANLAPGVTLIRGDVADADAVRRAMEDVDGCFHLAAIASVERGVQDWLGTHRVNLSGTITVFDAARHAGGHRPVPVVYASSAAVYGDQPIMPIHEDALTAPVSAYGADKLGCELHARVAGGVHAVPTFGLRFFNVFGPRQDPRSPYSGVISIFCDRLFNGQPISVFGDGGQTRDFIFVGDIVAGLLRAMRHAATSAPVANLASGVATSVLDLARAIEARLGIIADIRTRPPRSAEIRHSVGSIQRASEAFGFTPAFDLHQGLDQVLSWMRAGRPGLVADTPSAHHQRREPSDKCPADHGQR